MILLTFKEHPESRGDSPYSAFRWSLQGGWCHGPHLGFYWQYKRRETDCWHSSHVDAYSVAITRSFSLGGEHFWYDGPHCFFSLGFVHFQYANHDCKKCYEER